MTIWKNSFKSGAELEGTSLKNGRQSRLSLSSLNTSGRSTISYSVTKALLEIMRGNVSIGTTEDGNIFCECQGKENLYGLSYSEKRGEIENIKILNSGYFSKGIDIQKSFIDDNFSHWSLFVPRIAQLLLDDRDSHEEFARTFRIVQDELESTGETGRLEGMFILNDYLYESRDKYISGLGDMDFNVDSELFLDKDETGFISGTKSNFKIINVDHAAKIDFEEPIEEEKEVKETKKKKVVIKEEDTLLSWDRELTDEEKALIPELDYDVIVVSKEVELTARMIKGEIDALKPVNNILYYGGAGSGKSTAVKVLGNKLGLPTRTVTCSLNTEEEEFNGNFNPNPEGGFDFKSTAFLDTFMYGGIVEVQEFTALKPGVSVKLNSATDDTATMTLTDGRIVNRHPNCIIVFTTNVDYSGCNKVNGSAKDRFHQMVNIERIPREQLMHIITTQSGNNDKRLVSKLIDVSEKAALKIEDESIRDAVCSTRQLINWARAIKYTPDIIEAAKTTIVPGVSLEKEIQEEIIDTILRPMF